METSYLYISTFSKYSRLITLYSHNKPARSIRGWDWEFISASSIRGWDWEFISAHNILLH